MIQQQRHLLGSKGIPRGSVMKLIEIILKQWLLSTNIKPNIKKLVMANHNMAARGDRAKLKIAAM